MHSTRACHHICFINLGYAKPTICHMGKGSNSYCEWWWHASVGHYYRGRYARVQKWTPWTIARVLPISRWPSYDWWGNFVYRSHYYPPFPTRRGTGIFTLCTPRRDLQGQSPQSFGLVSPRLSVLHVLHATTVTTLHHQILALHQPLWQIQINRSNVLVQISSTTRAVTT